MEALGFDCYMWDPDYSDSELCAVEASEMVSIEKNSEKINVLARRSLSMFDCSGHDRVRGVMSVGS